jgi:hypothetical protein
LLQWLLPPLLTNKSGILTARHLLSLQLQQEQAALPEDLTGVIGRIPLSRQLHTNAQRMLVVEVVEVAGVALLEELQTVQDSRTRLLSTTTLLRLPTTMPVSTASP